jgi:hypothetical protein
VGIKEVIDMTYWDIKNIVKGTRAPLACENVHLENVIIEEGKDDEGHFYRLTTAQNNGWCKVTHYYETGTTTEEYTK